MELAVTFGTVWQWLKLGCAAAGFLALVALVLILFEVFRTTRSVRMMVARIEMLSDVGAWFSLFKKFRR